MTAALRVVQAAVSLSFFALGLFTVINWLRHRERSRGYLALALGMKEPTPASPRLHVVAAEGESESQPA